MKFPSKLKIAGHTWNVRRVNNIPHGDDAWGMCVDDTLTIWLRKDDPHPEETFLHECLHAISHSYGVPLEHDVIVPLERALAQLWRQL